MKLAALFHSVDLLLQQRHYQDAYDKLEFFHLNNQATGPEFEIQILLKKILILERLNRI